MCKTHENAKHMYVNTSRIHEQLYVCQLTKNTWNIIYMSTHPNTWNNIYINTINVMSNAYGNASNEDTHATCMLLLQWGMDGQKARIKFYRTHTVRLMAHGRTAAARLAPVHSTCQCVRVGSESLAGPTKSNKLTMTNEWDSSAVGEVTARLHLYCGKLSSAFCTVEEIRPYPGG